MNKQIKPYIISVAIALGVGALSALFTRNNMDIYSEVATPPLSPPAILFPLVWTFLYIFMGVSAAAIYTSHSASVSQRKRTLYTYAASLVVNFFWSIIFFNMRAFAFAFLWLLLLLYLIIKTILQYKEIEPTAAYLQIPYALWVAFAGYLNFGIWYLNR